MSQPSKSAGSHGRRRIVLTTVGSLGDLHPYVAIALGLQRRGQIGEQVRQEDGVRAACDALEALLPAAHTITSAVQP